MASRLNPYISFGGNARDAMQFYERVFGGTLTLNTFGEFGAPDAPEADNIMHGMLETDGGFALMGADTPPETEHDPGNNIAVSLSGDDTDELRGYWEELSDGGTVSVPGEKMTAPARQTGMARPPDVSPASGVAAVRRPVRG